MPSDNCKNITLLLKYVDIRGAFDFVDGSCVLRDGVCEMYITILKKLYRHTPVLCNVRDQLSTPFVIFSAAKQGWPKFTFLFNDTIDDVLQKA